MDWHQALPEYQPAEARLPHYRAPLRTGCVGRLCANQTVRKLRQTL